MIRVVSGFSPGARARIVGRTESPPLAIAAVPFTTCSGDTEMPCPNPTVRVAISFQLAAGWVRVRPASGNSMPTRFIIPMLRSQVRWRSAPTSLATFAAPRLDE